MDDQRSGIKVTASDALEFEPVEPRIKKAGNVLKTVLFVVLAVGGGAAGWAFYGDRITSLMGDSDSDVPIVRAELGPVKVRPASPGGLQVPDRDKLVYNRIQGGGAPEGSSPSVERLLPPPETPMPKPAASSPVASTASSGSSEIGTSTGDAATKMSVPPTKPKRINETPRVADVTRAEKPVPAPPAPPAPKVTETASASPQPKPVTAKIAKPRAVEPRRVATSTSKVATSTPKATPAPPPSAPVSPSVSGKAYQVQLAAARTPAAARGEWDKLRRKHLDLLGDLGLAVTKVDLGATKGVFYRLRVGPLKAEADARTLCKALAKRKVSCLVVRPGK